jgi:hypothetical protein
MIKFTLTSTDNLGYESSAHLTFDDQVTWMQVLTAIVTTGLPSAGYMLEDAKLDDLINVINN